MSGDTAKSAIPHHGLITVSLVLATTIQVLDGTVANIALPRIQGSLSASQEQMSWVLTSYIVASAVMLPLAGWLSTRIGRKKVLLASILGFTATSMLCGLAQTLPELVLFRMLQGLSGAALVPMSQATLLDINPPERHARAMSLWVMGVTIGPMLGPVLGAWLTEQYSWRWVFYINVPIGALCFFGLVRYLPESQTQNNRFDFFGFVTLSVGILALQLALDRGQLQDWFSSTEICIELACAIVAFFWFAVHSVIASDPFIKLRMFRDRNFATGNIFTVVIGALLFAPLAMLPPMLQGLLKYPMLKSGLLMALRGFGTLFAQLLLKHLMRFFDTRVVICAGLLLTSFSLWRLSGMYLQMDSQLILWSGVIQGIGTGLAYVPLATTAFATLSPQLRNEGTAVFNLLRNLGSSVGIAAVQAFFVRNTQIMHARLAESVTPYATQSNLGNTTNLLAMNQRVTEQAHMLAYNNVFKLMFLVSLACVPLAFLFRKPRAVQSVVTPIE